MSDITKSRIQTFKNKGKDQEVNVVKNLKNICEFFEHIYWP